MEAVIRRYWPDYTGTPEAGAQGWNNTTRFVNHAGGRYVLRVYETHQEADRILFEHEVLLKLAQAGLPYRTPVPLRESGGAGETLVRLEDGSGRYACIFAYIEGIRPADDDGRPLYAFGAAAGQLSCALAKVQPERAPAYRPYYELGEAYPLCGLEQVREFCTTPPASLAGVQEQLRLLAEAYAEILREVEHLRHLPHQLIHGDLNASNLLVEAEAPERIAALLDFEFCTHDARAMELAVILSGLPDEEFAVQSFLDGFRGEVDLEPAEIDSIPLLMRLRKVDVFLHFLTRYQQGTDSSAVLEEQARSLAGELEKLRAHEARWRTFLQAARLQP
ncbi:aminoglycoside phosphotransferase [Saccharibacillus sp. O16]|nr:aminoglycoside phosphotransferase [Saccharibacillus sp. O16]